MHLYYSPISVEHKIPLNLFISVGKFFRNQFYVSFHFYNIVLCTNKISFSNIKYKVKCCIDIRYSCTLH